MVNFIFDFDSTLVKNESLNEVLSLALNGDLEKINEIDKITKDAMEGLITPQESMTQRLKLATINKSQIKQITEKTKSEITDGMIDLISLLKKYKGINIFIVSGGFKEIIIPTAKIFRIPEKNIYANEFIYNENGIVEGAKDSMLLNKEGKVKLINKLKKDGILIGKTIMVGDGFTDLETFLFGAVDCHICFCGIAKRKNVIEKSTNIVENTDELKNKCINLLLNNSFSWLDLCRQS